MDNNSWTITVQCLDNNGWTVTIGQQQLDINSSMSQLNSNNLIFRQQQLDSNSWTITIQCLDSNSSKLDSNNRLSREYYM